MHTIPPFGGFMPIGPREITLREWFEMDRIENEGLLEWEKSRTIKRCKSCGQPYSFEKGGVDPRECQRCRGAEGELVL